MRLVDFPRVEQLVRQRNELLIALNDSKGNGLGVTIQGKYQDEDMINAVRVSVRDELRRRLLLLEEQLKVLGVRV